MLMKKCLLAMLILMLLNLNTGYADTDADICIRIMSLCCNMSLFQISVMSLEGKTAVVTVFGGGLQSD